MNWASLFGREPRCAECGQRAMHWPGCSHGVPVVSDELERQMTAWEARERLASTDPALVEALVKLGDEYGPTGVARAAADIVADMRGPTCSPEGP